MVAHGREVTSSRQITEVKQCRAWAQLVLRWLVLESCCRPCVLISGKPLISCRLCPPAVTGTWSNKIGKNVNEISCRKCAEFFPEDMRPYMREFQYQGFKLWSLLNSQGYQTINMHIYIHIYGAILWIQLNCNLRCEKCACLTVFLKSRL